MCNRPWPGRGAIAAAAHRQPPPQPSSPGDDIATRAPRDSREGGPLQSRARTLERRGDEARAAPAEAARRS